jgi:hypothetical protein
MKTTTRGFWLRNIRKDAVKHGSISAAFASRTIAFVARRRPGRLAVRFGLAVILGLGFGLTCSAQYWRLEPAGNAGASLNGGAAGTEPTGPNDPNWSQGVPAGGIVVPAGSYIFVAMTNTLSLAEQKRVTVTYQTTETKASKFQKGHPDGQGSTRGFTNSAGAGEKTDDKNKQSSGGGNGGSGPGLQKPQVLTYTFPFQPEWERFAMLNPANNADGAITITNLSMTSVCSVDGSFASTFGLHIGGFLANETPANVTNNEALAAIMVFPPLGVGIVTNPAATFSAPLDSGPWQPIIVTNDPDGNAHPQGGWLFLSEGMGLRSGEACDMSFNVQNAVSALDYTMYAYDSLSQEWMYFDLNLQEELSAQPSGNGSIVISWPTNQPALNLYITPNLMAPTWPPVNSSVIQRVGNQFVATVPANGAAAYFRLSTGP